MILSLDQSIANTGYLVVGKQSKFICSGVITTEKQKKKRNIGEMDDKVRRTNKIIDELKEIISNNNIQLIICEEYAGYSQSSVAADGLATARTVVVTTANLLNIPLFYVSAMDAKYALTKKKTASKNEMIESALKVCPKALEGYESSRAESGWNGEAEHIADAVGIYLAGRKLEAVKVMESMIDATVMRGLR